MIDRDTVEKILDTVRITDIVGEFVQLRRRGANYVACCPFHNEKTPSFSVSPSKGIFKCFGCGKAGNAVTFLMEHEQMGYAEALKYIARKYGIDVHETEESAEETQERLRRESLTAVSGFAMKFFSDNLFGTDAGRSIGLSYFRQRRGFSDETIRKFGLGYAFPLYQFKGSSDGGDHSLVTAALREGYKKEALTESGLCVEQAGGRITDRFHDRVMFPIHSLSGRVIAFGGRTLREDKSVAKYVNSPETEIYHKSRSLYGIFFAKSAIAKAGKCYLVEGYTDVISLHQAGVENVVASSGTSLTTDQIRLIHRFSPKVTVLYDGDAAGIKASLRGIDMLFEEGMEVRTVLLPDGEDPDSFARSHTKEEILAFLDEHETDFIGFKYRILSEGTDKDPIKRSEMIRDIIRTISVIPDRIARSIYIEECASLLQMRQDILYQEVSTQRRKRIESGEYQKRIMEDTPQKSGEQVREYGGSQAGTPDISVMDVPEKELLYYILKFGERIMTFEDEYTYGSGTPVMRITVSQYISAQLEDDGLDFSNPLYRKVFMMYTEERDRIMKAEPGTDSGTLQEKILRHLVNSTEADVPKTVIDITADGYKINVKEYLRSMIPEENVIGRTVPRAVLVFKLKYTESMCRSLSEAIGKADSSGEGTAKEDMAKELKVLLQVRGGLLKELNRLA
ncbi:MAG TPA: DNA primase [Candidatus Coprenecus stercoripullorum]|nr:DNA primase [Candidatus Coprenecus stercoripullorum]